MTRTVAIGRRRLAAMLALAMAFQAAAPTPARAWGPRGHRVAARVAEARLTPAAAKAVKALLNEGDTLVTVSTWADEFGRDVVRESSPWHYVNVPIDAPKYDDRYCGRRGCVVAKVRDYRKVLKDPSASRKDRQLALLFLVHFVQDVHQPLHVGDNGDKGGNDTQVQFFGRGENLHRIWDSGVINRVGGTERDWYDAVSALITPERAEAWGKGDVADWADESLRLAKRAYYFPKNAKTPLGAGSRVGDDYVEFAAPVVRERLAQAGVRLANELNAIFR